MNGVFRSALIAVLLLTVSSAGLAAPRKSASELAALAKAREFFDKGSLYAGQKKDNSAIEAYTKAIELNPEFVEAYTARGTMYVRTGKHERALSDFNKALLVDRNNVSAYNNRGMLFFRQGNYGPAVEDLSKAITISPNTVTYYLNRAAIYTAQKQHEKALADYTIAIGIEPSNADAYAGRGNACFDLGRMDQAAIDLKKACSLGSEAGCKGLKAITKGK